MAIYTDFRKIDTVSTDAAAINNSIRNILLTRVGSVPGNPTFGSEIQDVLFNQMDHINRNLLQNLIREALVKWERRILVTGVQVIEEPENNKLIASIGYVYTDAGLDINEQISVNLIE